MTLRVSTEEWQASASSHMIAIMSKELCELLSAMATRRCRVSAGEFVFRARTRVRNLYVVESGTVQLIRALPSGSEIALQTASPSQVLAEASIFAARYHCDAIALEDSVLRVVGLPKLRAALRCNGQLSEALLRHLAGEVVQARTRVEILALKTVQSRLEAWKAVNGGTLPPKGNWRRLAVQIGVSPEALYRELAKTAT